MLDRLVRSEFDAPARGGVANPHATDVDNSVVRETKIMEYRGFAVPHVDVDPSAHFPGYQAIDIVDVAIVDVNVPVNPFHTFHENVDAEKVTLVPVGAVGVGDFQTVDLPVGHVPQQIGQQGASRRRQSLGDSRARRSRL